MKTITPLSPAEQSAQLTTFVDFFVKEFKSELWYIEESTRGNIPGRSEASMSALLNVVCGLVNLAPIPGAAIGFLASYKLIKGAIELAERVGSGLNLSDYATEVTGALVVNIREISDTRGDIETVRGADSESAADDGKPIDHESLSVLARWLGLQLAQRYEQALTERLSTEPEAAIIGLARVAARRSLAFLAANGGMTGSPQERTERLLAGVVQGKPMSWYERPLKWFAKGERLAGRDGLSKEKFTAEALFANGAWVKEDDGGYVCYSHRKTEWFSEKVCGAQPKYGYSSGYIDEPALSRHGGETPDFAEWLARRVYQPVTREMIERYLASDELLVVRETNITAPQSLNAFLAENFDEFPAHGQAIFRGDLSGLDLSSGNFSGSDLSGSKISGNLSYSRFDGALLYATSWCKVTSAPGSHVSFARAQLGFSEMTGANFQGDVDVTQADLTCVNLSGASFGAVQQVGTKWYKANLTGVEYEAITKTQREQVALIAAAQAAQAEQFNALNDKVAALEAQATPLLESLAAKQPAAAGAGAGAGGEVPVAELEAMQQQEALQALLAAQEKRIHFEAYCEENLTALSSLGDVHTDQITALKTSLKRVQAAGAEGRAILQRQIDQLGQRVGKVETRIDGLTEQSSTLKLKVADLSNKLKQMHSLLEEQQGLVISKDLSLEDREAILDKSAIGKILNVYCNSLSQRQKDLHYYIRPDVVERIPDRKTPGEYMLAVEEGSLEDTSVPLLKELDAYLKSDNNVMLLLGEPGAGKSLFAWYASQARLQHYQMVLQDREPSETPWLPIVVELRNYRTSELKGLLPKYLKQACRLTDDELTAIQNDRKPAHKLLVVLDGFDELKQEDEYEKKLLADLFDTCGAQDWYAGQVKLVVTCRIRELTDAYTERQFFGHGVKKTYRRRILLPFSQEKISDYLSERTKAGVSQGVALLSAEEYLAALSASASVKEMVRNPFVLRLFVEALPCLVKAGINLKQIKRYDIYHGFVKQWFEREVNRLDVTHQKALGVDDKGVKNIAGSFERYAGILAMEMYRQDTLVVSYDDAKQDDPAFAVWSKMDDVIAETDIGEENIKARLAKRYQQLKATDKRKLAIKEKIKTQADYVAKYLDHELESSVDQVTAQLEAFKTTSPLRQAGDQYSFIHKSFYEYFLASRIINTAGIDKPLAERVSTVLAGFVPAESHDARRLWQEPETLDFICDYWPKATPEEKDRLKESWFAVIEATKGHPEYGVAGANAGTLLNWVNVSFTYKDWRGAHMPGVDFRQAYLEGSDLREADLSGAWLGKVQANNVDLRGATLSNITFSERPAIPVETDCLAIAAHPSKPIVAAAIGNVIRQYHFGENRWMEPPLLGHTLQVNTVSYSSDGRWLVSGSRDKTIRQWDTESGEQRETPLLGHAREVLTVCYSPDGTWLASGDADGTIGQWHAGSGEQRAEPIRAHTDWVCSVSYNPDGRWLASGGRDNAIRQWDAASGKQHGEALNGHSDWVCSVCYSPDGSRLASGSYDRTIRQWNAATGEEHGEPLVGHADRIRSICYSPDGHWLASSSRDNTIRQWHTETHEERGAPLVGHDHEVLNVAFSSDGRWLTSVSRDKTIRLWDAESGELRGAPLVGHTGGSWSVAFSPDGQWLASGSVDQTIRQWHAATGEQRGEPLTGHTGVIGSVSYSPDGRWLASGSGDQTIRQWDAALGEQCAAALAGHTDSVYTVSYSPDGRSLASGGQDNTLRLWSVSSGEQLGEPLAAHKAGIKSASYSPDGCWLASGSWDGEILQWNTATREQREMSLPERGDSVISLSYSPDGHWLASVGQDRMIRQWHATTGEQRGTGLSGHAGGLRSVSYSPDGRWLATGSQDSTIQLYTAATGEQLGAPLLGHRGWVMSVSFSPDGQSLVSCGEDGTVRRWTAHPDVSPAGSDTEQANTWRLSWGSKSSQMQLSCQGLMLAGSTGLEPYQVELLHQHGYQGTVNPATALIEDGNLVPEAEAVVPEPTSADTSDGLLSRTVAPAIQKTIAVVARRKSELLLSLAPILKRAKIFSPSHKLRNKLVAIYKNPINVDNTYVSEDMLRSSELGLTEKQICKFARVNLNAASESSFAMQVKDALDLFEAVLGKDQAAVLDKVAKAVGAKKQAKYHDCLLFARSRLAELSDKPSPAAGAGLAATPLKT